MNKLLHLLFLLGAMSYILTSCSKDEDSPQAIPAENELPVEFQADNDWFEDAITEGDVLWYRVNWDTNYTTLFIEWAELGNQDTAQHYTANIQVTAYALDTNVVFFEAKPNGYGSQKKSIPLQNLAEQSVLLKVELDASAPHTGSYALRAGGIVEAANVRYSDLAIGNTWTEAEVATDSTVGFRVYTGNATQLQIIWAEIDSPEGGYTGEIMGSVFRADGTTVYQIVDNGKDFLKKNKSHSDNPKAILVNPTDNHIKVHIQPNTQAGTFAIKIIDVSI